MGQCSPARLGAADLQCLVPALRHVGNVPQPQSQNLHQNIISYTADALTQPCNGPSKTFTITVNPTPTVAKPANQTVCNNASTTAVNFSGTVTGTTYSWTVSGASIGLSAGSGASIPAFTATNSTNAAVSATVTVTPSYTNPAGGSACTGTAQAFTITVNATPSVAQPASQIVCTGNATTPVSFSGSIAGASYAWTNNNATIGLASSGNGAIAAFNATNSGAAPVTATVTVTPSFATCTGSSKMFTYTVNPKYTITASAGSNGIINPNGNTNVCSGTSQTYTITASTAGNGYHIAAVKVDGTDLSGSAATAAGVGTGSGSYTFSNVTATHTIDATFAQNCVPPVISCNNAPITQSTDAGLCTALVNYTAATATGNTPSITYSQNSGTAFSKGLTSVTATATNGCGSSSCSFDVTVNDNQAPTITAPADITSATADAGKCYATITNIGSPVIVENCTYTVTSNAPVSNEYPVGSTTVTWSVTDGSNPPVTATQTVNGNRQRGPGFHRSSSCYQDHERILPAGSSQPARSGCY